MRNKLKQYLVERNITQIELAEMTSIAPCNISNIVNGKQYAYPGWRERIAKVLGVPENEIFGERELTETQKRAIARAKSLVDKYVVYLGKLYFVFESDNDYIYLVPLKRTWEVDTEAMETVPLKEIKFISEVMFS